MSDHRISERLFASALRGTASVFALLACSQMPTAAWAADSGTTDSDYHVSAFVGGQFTMNGGGKTAYGDPSLAPMPLVGINQGHDGWGGLNLSTDGWIFGLSVTVGKAETSHAGFSYTSNSYPYHSGSGDVAHHETHAIVDFTVGQDVGLGMFGLEGSSVISGGVEWANFSATTVGSFSYASKYYNTSFTRVIKRKFNGVGPVVSWNAATPIFEPHCNLTLDWGASVAVLFGSRKAYGTDVDFTDRSHGATVPRTSAYLGIGWHPSGGVTEISVGYAFNAAFGVLDGGYGLAHSVDRVTQGPYVNFNVPFQ